MEEEEEEADILRRSRMRLGGAAGAGVTVQVASVHYYTTCGPLTRGSHYSAHPGTPLCYVLAVS